MTNYAPLVAVTVTVVIVVVVVVVVVVDDEVDAVLSGPYTHCGIAMTSNVLSVDVIIMWRNASNWKRKVVWSID